MALRTLHIGVGGRGVWPLRLFPNRDDVQPVGLCDIRPEALAAARERTGLPERACWDDWQTALATCDCDAVVVITPPQLHAPMVLAAVEAGRQVLVEKPFTMDLREAGQIVAAADARGVKVAVAQQRRYSPEERLAQQRLAGGDLGAPEVGVLTAFSKRPGVHHSGQQRDSYAWERGIHDLDSLWALLGGTPRRVQAVSFNPSWSPYAHGAGLFATVEFSSGAVGSVTCSFMSHFRDSRVQIECAGGSLEPTGGVVKWHPADGGEPVVWTPEPGQPAPEAMVTSAWTDWIAGGPEPPIGMHQNLWTVALVAACGLAAERRAAVDLPELLRCCGGVGG
ncbi:MAG: Gfo/Idh/MocA family oxidoreductase [Fimbriimonadaceae bacterium]|nr:Gfo/Idh/MocA family oxidoreductase [Fimbriimonadaceae bacterium]